MRLLYRFYDPQGGRVLINGQDIKEVDLDSLRRVVGVVPQVVVVILGNYFEWTLCFFSLDVRIHIIEKHNLFISGFSFIP